MTISSLSSTRRQAGLSVCFLIVVHSFICVQSSNQDNEWRFKLPEGRTIRMLFHACDVQKKQSSSVFVSISKGIGKHNTAKHSCTRKRVCSLSKGCRWHPWCCVSDDVAQELPMPIGPQALETGRNGAISSSYAQRSRHPGSAQLDTFLESALVQSALRIARA